MAIEPVLSGVNVQAVWPRPDAEGAGADGHAKRHGGGGQRREAPQDEAQPVTNSEGQLTGTLINITA